MSDAAPTPFSSAHRRALLLAALLVTGCVAAHDSEGSCADCNVVLISIDALRPDHLGIYGYKRDTSPNIDGFFRQGTTFLNASSPSPCTIPSVKQFLAGVAEEPEHHPSLAERLKTAGFFTVGIVSQQMFYRPKSRQPEYQRGFEVFDIQDPTYRDRHWMTARTATDLTDRALAWMDSRPKKKFFMWLHYFDPHDPYEPPEKFRIFSNKKHPDITGDRRALMGAHKHAGQKWFETDYEFSRAEIDFLVSLYDGEIRYVDFELGRLFERFRHERLLGKTLFILTADHGERLCEQDNLWDHCISLKNWEIRVPLLIRQGSDGVMGQTEVRAPVSTLDIVPTVLHLVGLPFEKTTMDGMPLWEAGPGRKIVTSWTSERSVHDEHWRLLESNAEAERLYRIDQDPFEMHNVANQYPEQLANYHQLLAQSASSTDRQQQQADKIIEELKAVGYLR